MEVNLLKVSIAELTEGFIDNAENGVSGYSGRLDIRPPFQREFVYNDSQRKAVIDTILKGFPLNVMYWAVRNTGDFEIIDGQQRTISICQYITSDFSFNNLYFHNLSDDEKNKILNYELTVYVCSGSEREKLEWFKTINIAGEKLTDQELRNAVYHGTWVTNAKRYFSKTGCPAHGLGSKYLSGSAIRQDYLETVISWISNDNIEDYMGINQHKDNADELWSYFTNVINWIEAIFTNYKKEMNGLPWGIFYNKYQDYNLDPYKVGQEVNMLMEDEDVTKKSGIYEYIFDRKESRLSIRTFNNREKREAYERQKGICPNCSEYFEIEQMHADHITPWRLGGKTIPINCQMLCADCNRRKSGI